MNSEWRIREGEGPPTALVEPPRRDDRVRLHSRHPFQEHRHPGSATGICDLRGRHGEESKEAQFFCEAYLGTFLGSYQREPCDSTIYIYYVQYLIGVLA